LAGDAGLFSPAFTVPASAVSALIDLDRGFELHEVPTRRHSEIAVVATSKLAK